MNWLLKLLFRRKPITLRYTLWWSDVRCVSDPDGFDLIYITPRSASYDATSVEQALAMHRSDYPGTKPTQVTYLA